MSSGMISEFLDRLITTGVQVISDPHLWPLFSLVTILVVAFALIRNNYDWRRARTYVILTLIGAAGFTAITLLDSVQPQDTYIGFRGLVRMWWLAAFLVVGYLLAVPANIIIHGPRKAAVTALIKWHKDRLAELEHQLAILPEAKELNPQHVKERWETYLQSLEESPKQETPPDA